MNKQIFVLTQQGRNHAVELGGGHENILTPEKSAQNTEYDTQNQVYPQHPRHDPTDNPGPDPYVFW